MLDGLFSGGDGKTPENPVIINAENTVKGIMAEYIYMARFHGSPRVDFAMKTQRLLKTETGHMDEMNIVTKDGEEYTYYFDITSFFGRF